MKTRITTAEKMACTVIGTALTVVGLVLIALGLTFLPIIGLLVAFPVLSLAFYFFRPGKWVITAERETEPVVAETGIEESIAA